MLQMLWEMVTGSNIDFAKLIWEDFKHQTRSRKNSRQKQELMPYPRFTKLIVKYVMSKNDQIPKRSLSFQHVIKHDTTLGNLKFENKGTIDPVFGMEIHAVMLNNNIKASAEYLEYLKKVVGGSTPIVKGSKGVFSKKAVKIDMERLRIPKRRRSKAVTEEVYESEQMDDLGDYEETEEEEVVPLVRQRSTGKLKGLETLSAAAQLKLDMKKAQKTSKDDFNIQQRSKGLGEGSGITLEVPDKLVHKSSNEGAGVNLEVPDESNSSSSSSSFDSKVAVEDISSDEDEVTEKAENAKTIDAKKHTEDQVADEQEKVSKQSMPKHPSTKFDKAALAMYDQNDKLYKMMGELKASNKHPTHKALFNALVVSVIVDEDDMENLADPTILKKLRMDDHDKDPSADPDKDSKKKKKKDLDKKTKDQPTSSKGATLSKSSKTNKTVQADKALEDPDQEAEMKEELAVDEVINDDDHSQVDTAPSQDRPNGLSNPLYQNS
nr:hypothetical protein [Tanacetum cinerariifolium]